MYQSFYHFTGRPFQLTPDHHFFFESSVHKRAASYLLFGLSQGEGFIVITGEVGAGKTTLVRHLLSRLDHKRYMAAQIVTSQLGGEAMLQMVAAAWGLNAGRRDKARTLGDIEHFLAENHRDGRRCVLIVDEAQNLSKAALEELRMLSNFQVENQSVLQSYLVGQPQFRAIMSSPDMDQLRQRVIASYHLGPLNEAETIEYARHRLRLVGWSGDPEFAEDCLPALYRHSGGVPRRINNLASRLLLLGALEEKHWLSSQMVEDVAEELRRETEIPPLPQPLGGEKSAHEKDLLSRVAAVEGSCRKLEKAFRHVIQLFAENASR